MSLTTNWNNIKNKLEHQKYIRDKYYKKKPRLSTKSKLNKKFDKLKYFTSDIEPSPAEEKIIHTLTKLRIKYLREVSFENFKTPNGGYYRFDFFFPTRNTIVEYDGKDYHKNNESDKIKDIFCKKNKIRIVRISSESYFKLEKTLRNILRV